MISIFSILITNITDVICFWYCQQEIDGEEREQRLSMICASQNDIVSSDTDDGWSDGDAGRSKQLAGK